jgi:beta-glucosidase
MIKRSDFGEDFIWGVSTAAYQIEGANNTDGKGPSIWDSFINKNKQLRININDRFACDHYHRYIEDIALMKFMCIPNYRFSISWSRLFPKGIGKPNMLGVEFYKSLIDTCLENDITPWITLYHWDLPQALQDKGGWKNREIIDWFSEYTEFCVKTFGDRVKNWMILNEPMVFTGAGYYLGVHAPGLKGFDNFFPAAHHAALCQSAGGRIIRSLDSMAKIGTTFSYSHIEPYRQDNENDIKASLRVDALFNRFFTEPLLGKGYPFKTIPLIHRLDKYIKANDESLLPFEMDFLGLQVYTRELVKHTPLVPFIQAKIVPADQRFVHHSMMNWEVYPDSLFHAITRMNEYDNIKELIITENGAAFEDDVKAGKINDHLRKDYIQQHLFRLLKARRNGAKVNGYFVWSLMDNFEWAAGYKPRFGLVHVDFKTQKRTIKDSGNWYKEFLGNVG